MEWIKCSDRLPDCKYGTFLIVRKYAAEGSDSHVTTSFYVKDRNEARGLNKFYSRRLQGKTSVHFEMCESGFIVTHWMPLPKPPSK